MSGQEDMIVSGSAGGWYDVNGVIPILQLKQLNTTAQQTKTAGTKTQRRQFPTNVRMMSSRCCDSFNHDTMLYAGGPRLSSMSLFRVLQGPNRAERRPARTVVADRHALAALVAGRNPPRAVLEQRSDQELLAALNDVLTGNLIDLLKPKPSPEAAQLI